MQFKIGPKADKVLPLKQQAAYVQCSTIMKTCCTRWLQVDNYHHRHHHQFLLPVIWRRWVRINGPHCAWSLSSPLHLLILVKGML